VLESRLVRGAAGFGGELGHTPVKFDGPPCWCGGRGCPALYARGRGIAEAARARLRRAPGAPVPPAAGGGPRAHPPPAAFRAAPRRSRSTRSPAPAGERHDHGDAPATEGVPTRLSRRRGRRLTTDSPWSCAAISPRRSTTAV